MNPSAVLDWARSAGRDLPWRRTRDPWSVLVAEIMLHQTQVERVVPKYGAFLERFPTPRSCAAAPVGDVVQAWAGLGYNRRAVNLHRTAARLVADHRGGVPDELVALQTLPGVGPYTARAVLAFAFERDVAVVDTNVGRVLARQAGGRLGLTDAQAVADALVPEGMGWVWNKAVLDLGAVICTARAPACGDCPVEATCSWHHAGARLPDPAYRSAGASGPQGRFDGSDRQGRGRLVDALRAGALPWEGVPAAAGWPDESRRARRIARSLIADGLAVEAEGCLQLP